MTHGGLCWRKALQQADILPLQEAAEAHATRYLDTTNRSAIHAGRVTLRPKDISFVRGLRHSFNLPY